MEKEIILLGMAGSRHQCPYDCEVWSVNMGYKQIAEKNQHVEKIFIGHGQVKDPDNNKDMFDFQEINWLISMGVEVFCTHRVKGFNAKLYPLKEVIKKLEDDYFSSSICYMLAYALYKYTIKDKETGRLVLTQPLTLKLYGVDMAQKLPEGRGEYTLEKGGVEHWIGYARGLGIKVFIAPGGEILKTHNGRLYGEIPKVGKSDPLKLLRRKTEIGHEDVMRKVRKLVPKERQFTERYTGEG